VLLTTVELTWIEKKVERWLRFGRPVADTILDRQRRMLSFAPGSVFAFVRWAANEYGTVESHIDIVRTVGFARQSGQAGKRASDSEKPNSEARKKKNVRARLKEPAFLPVLTCGFLCLHMGLGKV